MSYEVEHWPPVNPRHNRDRGEFGDEPPRKGHEQRFSHADITRRIDDIQGTLESMARLFALKITLAEGDLGECAQVEMGRATVRMLRGLAHELRDLLEKPRPKGGADG